MSASSVPAVNRSAFLNVPPRRIEGIYREARPGVSSYYKYEILEATSDGNGNLFFSYERPISREKTAKTNRTQYLTYELTHGAYNGETFGINWDNVNSIYGQTYSIRQEAKEHGLRWDAETKSWRRRK